MNRGGYNAIFQQDQAVAASARAGVHDPKTILQLFAVSPVRVSKEEDISLCGPCVCNGGCVTELDAPKMAVGEEKGLSSQGDLFFGWQGGPAVTIAGDHADGKLRIEVGYFFCVLH